MVCGIYQIQNVVNNKKYIGSSNNIQYRWKIHKNFLNKGKHPNKYLQSAWKKYSPQNFYFIILEETDESNLIQNEQLWIEKLDTCNPIRGYNRYPAIFKMPRRGFHHTSETKQKLREKGKLIDNGYRFQKGSIPWSKNKKGIFSLQTIQDMSNGKKGNRNPNYGKSPSLEVIKKRQLGLINAHKQKKFGLQPGLIPWNKNLKNPYSEETLEKMSLAKLGKKQSLSTILKRANAQIGKKRSEETKQKMRHPHKKHKTHICSEEIKRKISLATKGRIPWNKNRKGVYSEISLQKMRDGRQKRYKKEI